MRTLRVRLVSMTAPINLNAQAHACGGPNGYLRELQHMNTWGVAFAALQASAPGARGVTPQQYHHWLDKVSQCEFADELILAATAEYLKLCIVVVPYTPSSAAQPWAISEHPCREARETQGMDETRPCIDASDVVTVLLSFLKILEFSRQHGYFG